MVKYADDVALLHFDRRANDDFLQREFDNVRSWSEVTDLKANLSKCSVTNIVTSKAFVCPAVLCNGECVQSTKVVG